MDKFYAKKDITGKAGPSDLTIKRILAFSKALESSKVDNISRASKKEEKKN